ncbi:hypothetical protein HUG10_01455 [Halorarum halophilum]|uniref:DUF7322 domain-containing protein n=1 Tax=Halorarum halophilum TaxID=2743090 RepID=A0A7D5GAA1_9EURY|nr:hypothetical protein [Halobaculum halophilum]QLG26285.1 hypothetical protein HUG10_01455 [Halobaculum halophilum]
MFDEDDDEEFPFAEPDPEERWGNPEEDLVSIPKQEVPEVENPADRLPDASEADPEVQLAFWTAVVYANVALFGVSFGLMLIGFRGQWRWGGGAVLVGLLAGIRVYQTYRSFRNRDRDGDDSDLDSS